MTKYIAGDLPPAGRASASGGGRGGQRGGEPPPRGGETRRGASMRRRGAEPAREPRPGTEEHRLRHLQLRRPGGLRLTLGEERDVSCRSGFCWFCKVLPSDKGGPELQANRRDTAFKLLLNSL